MTTLQAKPEALELSALQTLVRGELIGPDSANYDEARALYNAMIDKRPALIVRCTDVADVQAGLKFAAEHGLRVAIRGGGHNGGGLGSVEGGLVLDLAPMNGVRVDPQAQTVRVEGGATWGQVDHATHAFGLAVPSGIISTTGVGGLTLGGGLGHLSRKYGLTIDNLLEADVVLASGELVTASAEQHSDLFWAIRGGGGNFGIVTSFLFRGQPVSTVVGGPTLWTLDQAPEVMRWYQDFIRHAPEDLNGFFALMTVPPGPPFPEELHFQKMCGVVWCYTGPQDKAEEVFAPIREFGPPALYGIHDMPFSALQSAFDGLYPPGHQWYWRADFVKELSDEAIEKHLEHARTLPSMLSTMHLYPINGAAQRVGQDETAWSYRDATWGMVIVGVDPDRANAGTIKDWCVNYWEAVHPYSMGGAYVNMMMDEGQERVQAAYRGNYERLCQIKGRYDPENVFSVNQNIRAK
ncbi:FAD-binding oxidoreductase [Deinococcus sp. SM5_A1]|uniref:FAD-binding oxidoreductase n=1 Tax=Deinococcus sp. SM5_A1 TaxID=3379094 RepID=UPI00385833A2